MAVEVAASRAHARALSFAFAAPAALILGALVGVSAVVRFLLALAHVTPLYFADEYIYSTLAHELATTGRPTIRGDAASFPALLEPVLTAPFWLLGDPELALRLTQGLNALAMSVAAVPVFLLARRVGLGSRFALLAGAVTLVLPDLFYVAFILGEPIAFPLVLWAVYAGVRALEECSRRWQAAFVALSGFAAFARVQFVILPLAFFGAALVLRKVRHVKLAVALFAVPAIALAVAGIDYYAGVAQFELDLREFAGWVATDALLLTFAAGWVIVPGALVGLALARAGAERAFAALTAFLVVGLFVEAALYAVNANVGPGGRFQERYLFTLLPLLVVAFGLSLRHGGRARYAVAAVAGGLLVVSMRMPLSGYTDAHSRQDSPFLIGVRRFEELVGTANASLLVAVIAALLSLAAIATAFRPRLGTPALAAAGALLAAVSLGAWSLDARFAERARNTYLPADMRWVDHARLDHVTLVNTPGAKREIALEQMFWNRSIDRVVLLRSAQRIDAFASPRVRIAADGRLLVNRAALDTPLLVNRYAMQVRFRDATLVERSLLFDLWRPRGPLGTPRLHMLVGGRYFDGLLATDGYIRVWPGAAARLRVPIDLPKAAPRALALTFRAGQDVRRVDLRPGQRSTVTFDVPAGGPWTVRWKSNGGVYLEDGRPVSVNSGEPTLNPRVP